MRTTDLFILVDPWSDPDVSPPDLLRLITLWLNEFRQDPYALECLRICVVVSAGSSASITELTSITEMNWTESTYISINPEDISTALDQMTETYLKTVKLRSQHESSTDFLLILTEGKVRDPLHVSTQLRLLRDLGMSQIICATSRSGSKSPTLHSSTDLVSFVKNVDAALIMSPLTWQIEAPISGPSFTGGH